MNNFNKKLFNFSFSFKILKIIIIFILFVNINCGDSSDNLLFNKERKLISIEITPAVNSIPKGTSFKYTAIGTFPDGITEVITASVTWSSTNTGIADINASGLASAVSIGSTTITAASGVISHTTNITVTTKELLAIDINPTNATVANGNTTNYQAIGQYTDGSSMDITILAAWMSDDPGIASFSGIPGKEGIAAGESQGTTNITASLDGIDEIVQITVTPPELLFIDLTTDSASVAVGLTSQYTAEGTYSDDSVVDITTLATWSSSDNEIASIDNIGLATGKSVGPATITASYDSGNGTASINVTEPEVLSISISPENHTIKTWKRLQYSAIGTYTDSTTQDITDQVAWSSTNPVVAKISNSAGSEGLAAGITAGSVVITASMGAVNVSTNLTINSNVVILENPDKIHEVAYSAVTDNMGRIILCGYVQIPGEDQDAALWRYFFDGTLDTSFGTNGRITWDSPMGHNDYLYKAHINPDGTIMVGGGADNSTSSTTLVNPSILMGKFDNNGQPDTSFSPEGFKIIGINNSIWQRATSDCTFDSSGNLLTSGYPVGANIFDVGIIRTTNSGNIDTAFSNNGYFQFDSSQPPLNEATNKEKAHTVLVDSGNIYITVNRGVTTDSAILLIQADGTLIDAISGIPFKNFPRATFIRDNYIYIAGYSHPDLYYAWAKINKNDLTYAAGYGTGGYHMHNNPAGQLNSVYVNPIGEAYIGGYKSNVSKDGYMVKATSTGEVDTDWANNGEILYSDPGFPGSIDNIYFILIHNSELVVLGNTEVMINSTPCKRIFLDVAPENQMPENKEILSFNFAASENPALSTDVISTVNDSTIDLVVYGTPDIGPLVPDIRIDGATVSPADGEAKDFSSGPVTYTVTAVDLTTKDYTVNLIILPKITYKGLAKDLKTNSEEIYNTDMVHPTVIRAKDHIQNPLSTYYMYYSPHAHKGICMAYSDSPDGPWIQNPNNPIIDAHAAPDIRWISEAGKYYMWIHKNNSHTDLWTTTDGINFKDEGIVAIHADEIGTKNATYTRVYKHNNKYIMLYSGMNVEANLRSIYIANSDDAINWTQVKTPLVKPAPGENNEIFGPSFLKWGNKNLIVYQDNLGGKGGNLKCVIVNDNFDNVGTGGERHTLLIPPDGPPVNGRFRGTEFYKFSNKLYMFSGSSKRFKENIIYATAPL